MNPALAVRQQELEVQEDFKTFCIKVSNHKQLSTLLQISSRRLGLHEIK